MTITDETYRTQSVISPGGCTLDWARLFFWGGGRETPGPIRFALSLSLPLSWGELSFVTNLYSFDFDYQRTQNICNTVQ